MDEIQINYKIYYIYGLFSSLDGIIRYIGYTGNPKQRLRDHIYQSKQLKSHRHKWIQYELNRGAKIEMRLIECAIDDAVFDKEKEVIKEFKKEGFDLVNGNEGGRGGVSPTEEVRAKIRQSKLGNTWNIGRKPSDKNIEARTKKWKEKYNRSWREKAVKTQKEKNTPSVQRKITDEQIVQIYFLYNSGKTLTEVIDLVKLSKSTVSNILYSDFYRDIKIKYNLSIKRVPYKNQFRNKPKPNESEPDTKTN